jgi:hypothetical protein
MVYIVSANQIGEDIKQRPLVHLHIILDEHDNVTVPRHQIVQRPIFSMRDAIVRSLNDRHGTRFRTVGSLHAQGIDRYRYNGLTRMLMLKRRQP